MTTKYDWPREHEPPAPVRIAPALPPDPAIRLTRAARRVQGVFDWIAIITAILGGIAAVIVLAVTIMGPPSGARTGIGITLGIVGYTIMSWAVIKFYAIVAGYIHWRTTPPAAEGCGPQ